MNSMAIFCSNCGAQIDDNAQFCEGCGARRPAAQAQQAEQPQQQYQQPQQGQYQQQYQQQPPPQQNFQQGAANFVTNTPDETGSYDPADIEKNKTMAGLAYILFFLPLVACPESRYGKFHANQGLVLLILGIAGSIVLGIIPIIGWILLPIFSIAILALAIIGLINGFNGKAKELPLIGKFRIIK